MKFIDIDYIMENGYRRSVAVNFELVAKIQVIGKRADVGHAYLELFTAARDLDDDGATLFSFTCENYQTALVNKAALLAAVRGDRTAITLHTFAEADDSTGKGRE